MQGNSFLISCEALDTPFLAVFGAVLPDVNGRVAENLAVVVE